MLTFQPGQVDALARHSERNFIDRLYDRVTAAFPRKTRALGPRSTRTLVESEFAAARRHGFATERQIAHYVDLTFFAGARLAKCDWARPVIEDDADPERRIRRLQTEARRHTGRAKA